MASTTFAMSSSNSWVGGQVIVSSTSNGSSANSSTITITLQGKRTDGGTSYNEIASNFYIKINGTTVATDTNGCRISGTSWQNILVYTGTVNHNTDGTKTITITVGGNITETTFKFNETSVNFELDKIPRYATLSNYECIEVTQTSATFNWTADSTIDEVQYQIGTGTWYVANESPNSPITITGLVPGTSYDIRISVKRQDSQLWTNSTYIAITTRPITYIADGSGFSFNIGQDIEFVLTHPDSNNSICRIYYLNSNDVWTRFTAPFDEIQIEQGTTNICLQFSSIADLLYSLTPNTKTLSLKIEFGTIIDDTEYFNSYIGSAHVVNSNPLFTNFVCKNTDPITVSVLGEDNGLYMPCDRGNMQIQINTSDKAIAQNGASIVSYAVSVLNPNGSTTIQRIIPYSESALFYDLGAFYTAGTYNVLIMAYDSRGNTSDLISKQFYIVDYHAPNTTFYVSRLNGFDSEILLELSSVYSNLTINDVEYNRITSITYRTQSVEDLVWSEYINLTIDSDTINDNLLDSTIKISRTKGQPLTILSSDYSHNIEFVIADCFGTYKYLPISIDKGIPNIAESDDGYFAIGMLPDWDSPAKLQVATDIMATDTDGNRKLILEEIDTVKQTTQQGLTLLEQSLSGLFKFQFFSQTVTVNSKSVYFSNLGTLTMPEGYTFLGLLPCMGGYGDQWQVGFTRYNTSVFSQIYSYHTTALTSGISCYAIYVRTDMYNLMII